MSVWYEPRAAVDPTTGGSVNNVDVQIFANSDTSFTAPLTITDASGVPTDKLHVSGYILPGFYGPDEGCVAKAPGYLTPLRSIEGIQDAAENAANAAITAVSSSMKSITAGQGVLVDNSDPQRPAVSLDLQGEAVATNMMPTPYWTGALNAWDAAEVNVTIGAGEDYNGRTAVKATVTSGNTLAYTQVRSNSVYNTPNVPAGTVMWFAAMVKLSPECNGQVFIYLRDDPNNVTAAVDFDPSTPQTKTGVPTGSWQLVWWKATVKAGNTVTGVYVRAYTTASPAPAGASLQAVDWFPIVVDPADTQPPAYFDGNTAPTAGFGFRWAGVEAASRSEKFKPVLAGFDLGSMAAGGSASSIDWSNVKNPPATYTPSPHTHPVSDVTGLQDDLDGKADWGHTHTIGQVTDVQSWARGFLQQATDQPTAASLIGASGGGSSGPADWDTLLHKPLVIASGDTPAAARSVIGAGTSSLSLGTTASTALAGNGTAAAAKKLAAAFTINGHSTDGTANVTITQSDIAGLVTALADINTRLALTPELVIADLTTHTWPAYSTDPTVVRFFLGNDGSQPAPTAYNPADRWF